MANEGYAPACYEYAVRVMPTCEPYDLDDYGEATTEYYDDCRIAEKYFQMARDGGIDIGAFTFVFRPGTAFKIYDH